MKRRKIIIHSLRPLRNKKQVETVKKKTAVKVKFSVELIDWGKQMRMKVLQEFVDMPKRHWPFFIE